MTTNVIVRPATQVDLDSIKDLQRELFEFDIFFDSTLDANWPDSEEARHIRTARVGGEGILLVAEANSMIVGYLMASLISSDSSRKFMKIAEAEEFFILEPWRSRSLGAVMWEHFENLVRGMGCNRVCVSVSAANDRAVQFYKEQKLSGFVLVMEKEYLELSESIPEA